MRWWLLMALSVSQVAAAGPERQVQALLNAWQVDAAAKAVEPLLEALPDLPAIQAAAAREVSPTALCRRNGSDAPRQSGDGA